MNIFFILHQRILMVRKEYARLNTKIQELRDTSVNRLDAWLVLMGDEPLAVAWPWTGSPLIHTEPSCDLGTAVRTVQELLRRSPDEKSMVFVWYMDELGGDWQVPVTELTQMPGVNVVVMANQANQPEEGDFLRSLRYCTYIEGISGNFAENVDMFLKDFQKTGPATAVAPRSELPALLSFQNLETVHDPQPLSRSQVVAEPGNPAEPALAQPPLQVTEYPDLSDGKLDDIMGERSAPKTEAGARSAGDDTPRVRRSGETLPGPEPTDELTSTQLPAGPEMVIDVSNIQAKRVNLEKSPEPTNPFEHPKQDPENKPEPEPSPATAKDPPANLWAELDPPAELGDRFDPLAKKKFKTADGWSMLAASRRGKMHAHKALFREDAFGMGEAAGWHFAVVADGGGSRPLARVGANLAAEVAVNAMSEFVRKVENSELTMEETCRYALESGMRKAYEALQNEAGKRGLKLDDFGTTYLALAHRWLGGQKRHIVGVLQVGDGLIAAHLANKTVQVLANADVGESASQTLFITSRPWKDWLDRIQLLELEAEPLMFASMCDGVSDDLIPYPRNLARFFEFMQDIALRDPAEESLLEFLKYEKRGSFDDRTIALLVRDAPSSPRASSPALRAPGGEPQGGMGEEQSAIIRRPAEFSEGSPSSPADLPATAENQPD